ncbi:MAG TPA: hypothetical protein VFI41_05305 [Gemmatimonadales bacterium]|nr:hypothetical protein [Gemmatimonadales bacterium]
MTTPEPIAITTTLYLGPPEAAYGRERMVPVLTASEAATAIQSGLQALLPEGAWHLAAAVLRGFGADEEHIGFRLAMAGGPQKIRS